MVLLSEGRLGVSVPRTHSAGRTLQAEPLVPDKASPEVNKDLSWATYTEFWRTLAASMQHESADISRVHCLSVS